MGKWTPYSGSAVITTATGVWQTADLSAIVGSNTAVVLLQGRGNNGLMVRPLGGLEDTIAVATTGSRGPNAGETNSAVRDFMVIAKTDTAGRLEYVDPTGTGWTDTVFLLGYFVPDVGTTVNWYSPPGTTIPTSWATHTTHTNHRPSTYGSDATCLFSYLPRTEDDDKSLAARPYGEPGDWWQAAGGLRAQGVNGHITSDDPTIGNYYTSPLICEANADGQFDLRADASLAMWSSQASWSEWTNYLKTRSLLYLGASLGDYSVSWTTVDLSSYIGNREALVVLNIGVNVLSAAGYAAVRPYGAARSFMATAATSYGYGAGQVGGLPGEGGIVVCPTDSSGRIEIAGGNAAWLFDVELLGAVHGYDSLPPVVLADSVSPAGIVMTRDAPRRLRFTVSDPSGTGVPLSELSVSAASGVDPAIGLISGGVFADGVTGYIAPSSVGFPGAYTRLDVVIDWPSALLTPRRYTISVNAENKLGFQL